MKLHRVPLALLAGLIACEGQQRDTASVHELIDTPIVVIGEEDGPSEYLFQRLRHVFIDSHDNIIALDGSRQIRVFSPEGRHLRTFGGMGAGPGEFMGVGGAWLSQDSLVVWDVLNARVSYWTTDGQYLGDARLELDITPIPVGRMADGTFLVVQPAAHAPIAAGQVNDRPGTLHRYDPARRVVEPLHEVAWEPVAAGISPLDPTRSMYSAQPFGATTMFAIGPDSYYEVQNRTFHAVLRTPEGVVADSVPLRGMVKSPITDKDRQQWVERAAAAAQADVRPAVRRWAESLSLPAEYPTIESALLDHSGVLWLKRFDRDSSEIATWITVSRDGTHRNVALPSGFKPTLIDRSRIAGVLTDSLGIERIAVYARPRWN